MRKLTIAAAALFCAACFSGNASALTGSYAEGVKTSSDAVKVAYCVRRGGCCRRVYYTTCGCGCGCGGGGFFGLF